MFMSDSTMRLVLKSMAMFCLLMLSCTVTKIPRFEYTSSVPEITKIYRWRIEGEPHIQPVNLSGNTRSQIDPEFAGQFLAYGLKWVDSVKSNLSRDDHFQFYDNPPVDGVIHVAYYGQVHPEGGLQAGAHKREPNPKPSMPELSTEMYHDMSENIMTSETLNRIDSVNVTLFNSSNTLVGQVRMARAESRWGTDEEVTASRVAKVIRKLVNQKK
jgi:hypothetical protein